MSRPIEHRFQSAHPPADLFAALTDEAFLRARLAKIGGRNATLEGYSTGGAATRYTLRQTVDAEFLPQAARALVKGDLVIERAETWTAAGGGYQGTTAATVPGMPGSMRGTTTLTGDGSGVLVFSGSVKVGLPLIGGNMERLIVRYLGEVLDAEASFVDSWLDSR